MEAELSLRHEIDHNPKPEDAGTFQIHVSVLGLDTTIGPINCVISYDIVGVRYGYRGLVELKNWFWSTEINPQYICFAFSELNDLVRYLISSVSSRDCAVSVYMTTKVIPLPLPPPTDEEAIQASFDETADDIPSRPASKLAVGSLSRNIYKNNKKKTSNSDASMCTICLEEFKKGEMVVTLPCGHEFGDCCIMDWFATHNDCPLCRFELPCEN